MFSKLFFLYIFSDVCQIQELVPFLARLHFQKTLVLILLIGLILNTDYSQALSRRLGTPLVRYFFILAFWMVCSVPFSVYPGGAFAFLTQDYWKELVSFIIVLSYVLSIEDVERTIWAYILGIGLLCLFGLVSMGSGRLEFIESYDANELAANLVIALPFAFWKVMITEKMKKIVSLLVCILILVVVIKTQSRGAFIGILVVALVTIKHLKNFTGKFPLMPIVAATLLGGMAIYYCGGSEYVDRISSIVKYEDDYNLTSDTGRLSVWKNGLQRMIDSPLLGVGVNQFAVADGMSRMGGEGKWNAAHNSFLQVGVELGVPGFILYVLLIVSSLKKLRRIAFLNKDYGNRQDVNSISFSIITSFYAFCVTGFFLSMAYGGIFIFLIAMSSSFIECFIEDNCNNDKLSCD